MTDSQILRLPALEVRQGLRRIYCFAVDGKRLYEFAAVPRIRRDAAGYLLGYQRLEVSNHIRAIQRYLESENPMLPNALVLAFDKRVRFEPTVTTHEVRYSVPGELVVPINEALDDDDKPAWVVDGQQRIAAIRDADIGGFPVAVVGFIADHEAVPRAQFLLVNNTKPLPKGLVHELLSETDTETHLPPAYARRQLPASLMARLNGNFDGPFYRAITTPTSPDGYIKDNSVLRMIEHSLYQGALYQYRDPVDGVGDIEQMLAHLNAYWDSVRKRFPEAWSLPPRLSLLTHGAGIQAMGFIMDYLTENISPQGIGEAVTEALRRIEERAAWTGGTWNFGSGETRKWKGFQDTPNDVRSLTDGLLSFIRNEALS